MTHLQIIFSQLKQEAMNNFQFTLEDSLLMSIQSPVVFDVCSDSGEECLVQPGDLPDLQDCFRVGAQDQT